MDHLKQNPMYRYLMILVIAASAGLQGWVAIYTNFAKEVVKVDGFGIGVSQSVREIPGFLTFLVIYILIFVKEHRLSAWSVVLLGFGISLTGFFTSFTGLLFTTFTMSVGFHYFETTNKSLTVQYFNPLDSATVFARLRGYGALANIAVGITIWALSFVFPYKINFLLLGIFIFGIGVYMLMLNPIKSEVPHQTKKLILKKRYWLYYLLNFLSGARRQIFTVFAIFLLVDKFELNVSVVAGIYVVNYALTYIFNPLISKAINEYGERVVLSLEGGSLILLFLGYALIDSVYVVVGLFIMDSIFMNFSIGLNTYLQKTADKQDLGSLTAVGFTINHLSAVVIPLFGGFMWILNWRLPFIIGACLTFISLLFTQLIKTSYHHKGKIIVSSN
jgi:MFS family permease